MTCDSNCMKTICYAREIAQVARMLDELSGHKPEYVHGFNTYNPCRYLHISRAHSAKMVSKLCAALQSTDVTKYSPEMQSWWGARQAADKARQERAVALTKLTPSERQILGLE